MEPQLQEILAFGLTKISFGLEISGMLFVVCYTVL